MRSIKSVCILLALCAPTRAQNTFNTPDGSTTVGTGMMCLNGASKMIPYGPNCVFPLPSQQVPVNSAGAFQPSGLPATLGVASAQVLNANQARSYLFVHNPCGAPGGCSAYIVCRFGSAPSNPPVAGDLVVWPGQSYAWESNYVPPDSLYCLATVAATPYTVAVK